MNTIRVTPVVRWLLILNIAFFLVQMIGDTFLGTHLLNIFALVPALVFEKHMYWQFLTYAFMHADLFHILFNMLILWMIGTELEARWGEKFFLKYYLVSGVAAGFFYLAVQLFLKGTSASFVPLVGSSGAVYGLLVAYGIIFSERTLLFMMIFPMKAKHFVWVLAAIEFVSSVFYSHSGVANIAHLGGMVAGFTYLYLSAYFRLRRKMSKNPGARRKLKARPSHLKLVVNNELFKEFEQDDDVDEEDPGSTFH